MKKRLKIIVDALMTLGLLLLMGFQFWGDAAHEWIGAGMFVLFIAHHILNLGWWRGLFKGRYTPARVLVLMVDVLTLAAMLGLMVSGVILSRYVFDFLPIKGKMSFARLTICCPPIGASCSCPSTWGCIGVPWWAGSNSTANSRHFWAERRQPMVFTPFLSGICPHICF